MVSKNTCQRIESKNKNIVSYSYCPKKCFGEKNILGTSIISSWNWSWYCFMFCPCQKTLVILDQVIWSLHPISYFLPGHVSMGGHFLIISIKCGGHLFADPTCNQLWSPRSRRIDWFYPSQLARRVGHTLSCPFEKSNSVIDFMTARGSKFLRMNSTRWRSVSYNLL